MIHPIAGFPLSSRHRVSQILFHPSQPYLAVQSHERSVEIFRIRTAEEARKKQARRKKRAKEKGKEMAAGKTNEPNTEEPAEENEDVKLVDLFNPHVVVRATGKIRSFDFGDDSASKSGVQVSGDGFHVLLILCTCRSCSWRWLRMRWKYIPYHSLQNLKTLHLKQPVYSLSICLVTERTFEPSV